ncbi:NUDIX hydrolase [Limnochorda pilosa]|uniref:NUDIX hydrolase n=1 Tax=Limnochorda pilosa TaxID=1555112 RepID=A0A0K2SIN5_LIMPI|nr:NUDIX hydrolase [Limnochorda pilosa]
MEALARRLAGRPRRLLGWDHYVRTAVLLPLVTVGGEWHLLFEVRSETLKRQPGEVCFPGGHLEAGDRNPRAAAVRETGEELNLEAGDVEVLGDLDVLITPWRLVVYPHVGVLRDPGSIRPARSEIAHVFTVPLEEALAARPERHEVDIVVTPREDFPFDKIPHGRAYPWRRAVHPELFFQFRGHVVWGLTALILEHFLSLLRAGAPDAAAPGVPGREGFR